MFFLDIRRISMKKSSKPGQAAGIILAGLVCFLAIPLLGGSQALAASLAGPTMLAQAAPGQARPAQGQTKALTGSQQPPSPPSPITPYVASGYSIVGPINVSSVSPQAINLYTGHSDLGIDLRDKKVTVIDQNYGPLALSAVQKGTRVYVCRKANNVVVMVLPAIKETGANK
jgi:hypothetical protein